VWTEVLNSGELSEKSETTVLAWPAALAALLLALGIGAIGLSFTRHVDTSGRIAWSQDEARQYQAAAKKLHGLSHEFVHASQRADGPEVRAELHKAQAEYDALRTQLESAMARPWYIALLLRVGGVLLMLGAAFCLFLQPGSNRSRGRRASDLKPFHLYSQPQPSEQNS
jgi:hypothetical protein